MSAAAPDDPFAEHDDSTASSETELVELKAVRGIDVERAGRVESVLVLEAGGASAGQALIGVEDLERFPVAEEGDLAVVATTGAGLRVHCVVVSRGGARAAACGSRPCYDALRAAATAAAARRASDGAIDLEDLLDDGGDDDGDDPLGDASLARGLEALGGYALAACWYGCVFERRLAVRSGDPRLLAPLLSGVLKCMEPLPFVHIFAPVLPPGSSEVLEAPVPFAVGARDEDADAWYAARADEEDTRDATLERGSSLTSRDGRDDYEFVAALVDDGCLVVDADSGAVHAPADAPGAPPFARLCGDLGRRCGAALRRGGGRAACEALRAETRRLVDRKGSGSLVGPLRWACDDGSSEAVDAEFADECLWLYDAGGPLALWVPGDAVESVSPLDACAFEVRYAAGTGAWSGRPRADRAVLEAPSPGDARRWVAGLVAGAAAAARDDAPPAPRVALMRTLGGRQLAAARRRPLTPKSAGRRLSESFWEPPGDGGASPRKPDKARRGCLNGAQGWAGPPADALTTVRALLERLVATVKFFHAGGNVDLAVLREVRESAAFAAFEEASGALRAADLDALADDAAKHAFWINAHNLVVLHGCVANGPPATATAFAPVPAYLAWAKRQRYAFGELTLSAIDIEHALLRRGDIFKGTLAIALLLPRFGDDDARSKLKPAASPRALALSLFAATASSAPLRVVHARSAPALQDELDANAADFLRRAAAVTKKGVTLPGPLRYNSQDLGSGTADILARVDALLKRDNNPFSWFESNGLDPATAKLEFGAYDWAPKVDIHWDHCAEAT